MKLENGHQMALKFTDNTFDRNDSYVSMHKDTKSEVLTFLCVN